MALVFQLALLDFLHCEDDVLVEFLVHRELARLPEGLTTPLIVAFEGFLLCVDVHMFLKVLCQCEGLHAENADMLLGLGV